MADHQYKSTSAPDVKGYISLSSVTHLEALYVEIVLGI